LIGEGEVKGTGGEVVGTDEEIVDRKKVFDLNFLESKVRNEIARIKADILY